MHRRDLLSALGTAAIAPTAAGRPPTTSSHSDDPRTTTSLTDPPNADRTDPPTLDPLASVAVEDVVDVTVDGSGETAYVSTREGFVVVDVSDPADPAVVAERTDLGRDLRGGPVRSVRDATVDGDRLLVTAEGWAAEDVEGGAAFLFDVSDPADPREIAVHRAPVRIHNGDVAGDHAYVVRSDFDRWPMVVLDATDDLAAVARWSVLDAAPEWRDIDPSIWRLHDLFVADGVAYLAYWETGAWLLSVSDPTDPTPVANLGGRDPGVVRAITTDPFVETIELPGNVTAVRPSGDRSLVAWSKEADDHLDTARVGGPGGVDVWRPGGESGVTGTTTDGGLDAGEHVVTLAAPEDISGVTHAKNFGWRGDRLYVAFRDAGVRAYDLSDPTAPLLLGAYARPESEDFHAARPLASGFVGLTWTGPRSESSTNHLYTFPKPSGDGAVPAPTGTPYERAEPTPSPETPPTVTASPTPTGPSLTTPTGTSLTRPTGTASTPAGTSPATPTAPASRTPPTDGPTATDPPDGGGSIPGFGPLAALGSAALAAALAGARRPGERS